MKTLQIITGNDNGGGGKHVLNICTGSNKYFETVLGCIGKGDLYEKAKSIGVKTKLFTLKSIINGELQRYVKDNNIDIVNFHGAKAFFAHGFIHNKINIPTVATIHSNYKRDFMNNKFKYYFFTPLSIKGIKSFKNYICVSNYIKNMLIKDNISGEKFIVNNGIDIDSIRPCKDKNKLIKELDLNEKDFIYIMVARMHPIKNHKSLIDAFSKLCREYDDVKLLLVGDGVEEENLKYQVQNLKISNRVKFIGFKDNVLEYINLSDISLLTSFNEGGSPPLVILESGVLNIPVIASDVSDIPQTINSNNGFLINPNSVDSIYSKMREAYINQDKLKQLGFNLYKDVVNNYSIDNFCKSYYDFYKSLI